MRHVSPVAVGEAEEREEAPRARQESEGGAATFKEPLGEQASVRPKRILVVEDDPTINDIITLLLSSEGYAVTPAFSAQEALEALRKETFDLVTLDLALGERDGREILREVKSDPKLRSIPVLVVSAYTGWLTPEERRMASGILEKPFDVEDLVQRIRTLIGPSGESAEESTER
jgi:DNA-binding response OmpR family regulator